MFCMWSCVVISTVSKTQSSFATFLIFAVVQACTQGRNQTVHWCKCNGLLSSFHHHGGVMGHQKRKRGKTRKKRKLRSGHRGALAKRTRNYHLAQTSEHRATFLSSPFPDQEGASRERSRFRDSRVRRLLGHHSAFPESPAV